MSRMVLEGCFERGMAPDSCDSELADGHPWTGESCAGSASKVASSGAHAQPTRMTRSIQKQRSLQFPRTSGKPCVILTQSFGADGCFFLAGKALYVSVIQ